MQHFVPTEIQQQSIPKILSGRDLLGMAQTGSGKTGAFVLPIMQQMIQTKKDRGIHALILAPTRELAIQISQAVADYGKFTNIRYVTIYGGVSQRPQVQALNKGVDMVIATPGRLLDLLNQGHISLDTIHTLVLDEADRMLDMGFIHDIRRIIGKTPCNRQTLLFSATMPKEIISLSKEFMNHPEKAFVHPTFSHVKNITTTVLFVDHKHKFGLLHHLLTQLNMNRILVFTRTKRGADRVTQRLGKKRINADSIHGNKSQNQRKRALKRFKKGKTRVLVATDVAARGIDVQNITHVINYDIPPQPETYVHRIGRTARAGTSGTAISFCSPNEHKYLKHIEIMIQQHLTRPDHPFRNPRAEPKKTRLKWKT